MIPWGPANSICEECDSVRFEKSTLQEKANCKLNLGRGMLVFFFPFFENLGSYVYDSMRAARTDLFLKGISAAFFVEKLYGMRARALASACLPARAGPPATAWLLSEYSKAAPQSGQMSCGR